MRCAGGASLCHTEAVLLRSVDVDEADRIVTLFSKELGKVAVVAKGARRSRRRFSGSLEPYAIIDAELRVGSRELGRMSSAAVVRSFPGILGSLARMTAAAAVLEVVQHTTPPRLPDADLWAAVVEMLEAVDRVDAEEALDAVRAAFWMRILTIVGLAPGLESCVRCGKRAPAQKAAFFASRAGGIVCRACGGGETLVSGRLRARLEAWAVEPQRRGDLDESETRLVTRVLRDHTEHQLGRPLRGSG